MNCINISHPDFTYLLQNSLVHADVLKAKISIWMDKNTTDRFPTLSELGLTPKGNLAAAINLVEESVKNNTFPSIYKTLVEEGRTEEVIKDIAQQAQNLNQFGIPHRDGNEERMRANITSFFGKDITNAAIKAFPLLESIEQVTKEHRSIGSIQESEEINNVKQQITKLRDSDGNIPSNKMSEFNRLSKLLRFLQLPIERQVERAVEDFADKNNLTDKQKRYINSLIKIRDSFTEIIEELQELTSIEFVKSDFMDIVDSKNQSIQEIINNNVEQVNKTINEKSQKAANELGIEINKEYSANELDDFIQKHGSKQVKFIWNLIKNIAEKLGVKTRFSLEGQTTVPVGYAGHYAQGQIDNRASLLQTPDVAARVIVHELIHGVTNYIIDAVKNNKQDVIKLLTQKQINAVKKLSNLLKQLQSDSATKDFYGSKNEDEILAELTHDGFVEALQNKKLNFVEKLLDYILDILGIETNAYDEALQILKDLIENPIQYKELGFVSNNSLYSKLTEQEKQLTVEELTKQHRSITALKDLAAKLAYRIGGKVEFVNRTDVDWKGYNQGMTSVLNEAYMTPDTPFHEILAHPIIRAIKEGYYIPNYVESEIEITKKLINKEITKEQAKELRENRKIKTGNNQLYQSLLKELETGRGKEVFEQVKRDYNVKDKSGIESYDLDTRKATNKYTLEEQQEEAIVTLLGLMAADKLDAKKDATLISKLKELWKQISDLVKSLLRQDGIKIDELPITTTLNDLAEIMAYGNNKIILPGYKVEYSTPLGNKYDTLEEVNQEIRGLADANVEVDLSGVKIDTELSKEELEKIKELQSLKKEKEDYFISKKYQQDKDSELYKLNKQLDELKNKKVILNHSLVKRNTCAPPNQKLKLANV